MKVIDFYWEHPELKKYVKQVDAGQYLFKQRQFGTTMFIIVRGLVELIAERAGAEHVINIVQAGQFLGEKAIVKDTPYRRAYSARAKSDTIVIELDLLSIERIKKVVPDVISDVLKQMFQIAAERLDRANYLNSGLRSSNNLERLVHLIVYFARSTGRKGIRGAEFFLRVESVQFYIDMPRKEIEDAIRQLLTKQLILKLNDDWYELPSELALLESLPRLKEQLKAGYYEELDLAG